MRNGGSERPTVRGVKFVDYKIKILLTDSGIIFIVDVEFNSCLLESMMLLKV